MPIGFLSEFSSQFYDDFLSFVSKSIPPLINCRSTMDIDWIFPFICLLNYCVKFIILCCSSKQCSLPSLTLRFTYVPVSFITMFRRLDINFQNSNHNLIGKIRTNTKSKKIIEFRNSIHSFPIHSFLVFSNLVCWSLEGACTCKKSMFLETSIEIHDCTNRIKFSFN